MYIYIYISIHIHHAPAVKPLWVSSGSRPPEKKELHRFRGSSPSGGKKTLHRFRGCTFTVGTKQKTRKKKNKKTKTKNRNQTNPSARGPTAPRRRAAPRRFELPRRRGEIFLYYLKSPGRKVAPVPSVVPKSFILPQTVFQKICSISIGLKPPDHGVYICIDLFIYIRVCIHIPKH